jgi:hypothetical protein
MRHISPRRVVLLAALLLLIAPWASAAPRHRSARPARASLGIGIPDVLSLAWQVISGGWMKEGCNIDPDGRCFIALPTKEGCQIDPSGRCLSALPVKTGCQIDPSGRCISTSAPVSSPLDSADLGCQIDPGGRCIS